MKSTNPLMTLILLYCYYSIGSALERNWGTLRFNLYYLAGVLFMDIFAITFGGIKIPAGNILYDFSNFYSEGMINYLHLSMLICFATTYPDTQFYLFFFILYERGADEAKTHAVIKCWAVLAVGVVLIFNQVVIANVSYHKAQIAYEKSYGVLIRIADRIEKTPDAENCGKIMVIGALSGSEAYSVNLPPDITGVTDGFIIRADDETVGQSVFTSAINDYCGKNYKFVSGKEKEKLLKDEKIKSMNKWPNENCVKVIDDTVIIKLGEK
jgi:hypothetical protein